MEEIEDVPAPQVWPKKCPCCARVHDASAWQCLNLVGFCGAFKAHGVRYAVELRNCICASTIGIEVKLAMAEPTTEPTFTEKRAAQATVAENAQAAADATFALIDADRFHKDRMSEHQNLCSRPFGHFGDCEPWPF